MSIEFRLTNQCDFCRMPAAETVYRVLYEEQWSQIIELHMCDDHRIFIRFDQNDFCTLEAAQVNLVTQKLEPVK